MKLITTALLLSTLVLAGCEMQPAKPSSNLNDALAHYQAGRTEMALPLLTELHKNPETPVTEKRQALTLAATLYIENAEWEQAEALLQELVGDTSLDADIFAVTLGEYLKSARAEAERSQQLGACEGKLTQSREERRNLESTLRKLRELSLE